ncbi:7-cyano-7-deazaguanine synthase [Thiotrichales bacterium 19S9-12]|nr:7-cyano-7-deazaguanine synthase [Thiotrichales bacterium 19S9-11]MCF6810769.1 7-cyano-7-deazaguanine synthase [Thiotrichales bacterium 19S9-12]
MKYAVLSFSGGMDSSSLLIHLLAQNYQVIAISFDYGQKHKVELDRASQLSTYLKDKKYPVDHHLIKLDGLDSLLYSTLISGGDDIPEGHYQKDNMKKTVVPNRNKIFSSIIQSIALSIAERNNQSCLIAMGIHAGDHQTYPDCREEFRNLDYQAFISGNWDAEKVTYYTPYLELEKYQILEDLEKNCEILNLDFNQVLERTITSYNPILINGQYYSDYKSASSISRIEAFIKLNQKDPIIYADETGIVDWNSVKNYCQRALRIDA